MNKYAPNLIICLIYSVYEEADRILVEFGELHVENNWEALPCFTLARNWFSDVGDYDVGTRGKQELG
ncbi:MAG: hypothetical protein Fur0011_1560 [Candidatus Microgenomates bacterium]